MPKRLRKRHWRSLTLPRGGDPYKLALETATERLEKAKSEREAANKKLAALNTEIPRLERIISVLNPNQKPVPFVTGLSVVPTGEVSSDLPIDLTGMGSMPASGEVAIPDAEDVLLPEPTGKPILE